MSKQLPATVLYHTRVTQLLAGPKTWGRGQFYAQ